MANTAEIFNFPDKTTEKTGGRMADLSNGYTKVANEIQKLKPRIRMSGREWQCFEAIIWLTYGWNKKQDRVTNTVIADLTGLEDTHVSNAIKALAERQIIFSHKQGGMRLVGVNTELSAWILDKPKTVRKLPKTVKTLPESVKLLPKTVDTQYKNKNSIKNTTSENSAESTDTPARSLPVVRPDAAIQTPKGDKWGTCDDLKAAEWIFSKVAVVAPTAREPNWPCWSNDIRLMRNALKISHREICELFEWANADHFWQTNVMSPSKLREKWDTLKAQKNQPNRNRQQPEPQQPAQHWNSREAWENEFL